ncbi:CRISPR-associated CARF protein Csa3 [Methanocalculus sp.]|uniref:CRISPR-associated CARF protein Csa3 n=1 Tax=Methanocalculus sp. TaxID=2004547 RepID=UPI002624292F|nr:CRISPR-associated CARF protein Csa3 [Methanocalculus sp.]MDG6249265.1 CRISPR-associated CARF protein Csa3 [Methanocalculus sp.]
MRIYISPLGFDTTHLVSLLFRLGIEGGDKVCLIRPKDGEDDRALRAIEDVRGMLRKISSEIQLDVIHVNNRSFHDMTATLLDFIRTLNNNQTSDGKLIVNLSGGPREVLVSLTLASIAFSAKIHQCAIFSDISRELETIELPHLGSLLEDRAKRILADIATHDQTSMSEIGKRLQISESTVSRQCSKLAAEKYILFRQDGRYKIFSLLPKGEIALKM